MLPATLALLLATVAADPPSAWTVYVANDNCPDYTWGLTEAQTRQAFADIVRGHLDEMTRTDARPPDERDRYNAAVTQEVLCFAERYPERKDELVRRIREGRLYVSPYLCNTLWAFQDVEGTLRAFMPARRLEREWGLPPGDTAHHIELPSLPWGHASLLAACGIKNLSVPYYDFDSTFARLRCPPVFLWKGPDGASVRVALDRFASGKASYTQGAFVLDHPDALAREWLPHYAALGPAYPLRVLLASGTHGDISPASGARARAFAEAVIRANGRPGGPRFVNATLPQFWEAVDRALARGGTLPARTGDFGHSWDLWPTSLAATAADARAGGRALLAAETLQVLAGRTAFPPGGPDVRRAERCWVLLSDHAWNGADDANRRHNAELRRLWADDLARLAADLARDAWGLLGPQDDDAHLTLVNTLGAPRRDLVRLDLPAGAVPAAPRGGDRSLPCQAVTEEGGRVVYLVSPEMAAFTARSYPVRAAPQGPATPAAAAPRATPGTLDGPFYRARVDPRGGGLASLVHKPTGREVLVPGGPALARVLYHDGRDRPPEDVRTEVVAEGPVLARLRIRARLGDLTAHTLVTLYADLDQVDFEVTLHKPPTPGEQRVALAFPVVRPGATLRIATPGAVLRPRPQPEGDLLPGADPRRFAVQEFLDASADDFGVTVASPDAFALRQDLGPLVLQLLGNDHNPREVTRDQHGRADFRFRFRLRAHRGGYDGPAAHAFGRAAGTPLLARPGRLDDRPRPRVTPDAARVAATCLKPADDRAGGVILRLQEVAGHDGPTPVRVAGYRRAVRTDLLERDGAELPLVDGVVSLDLRANGFAAVRLIP